MVSIIYPSGNWATGILILFKQEVLRHTSQKKWICLSPTGHVSERLWHISYFIEPLPSSKEWIAWCSNNKANEREMVDLSNVSNSASNSNREVSGGIPGKLLCFGFHRQRSFSYQHIFTLLRGHELPFLFDYNTKIRTISQYSQFKKRRTCFFPSYTYILLFCQEAFFK